MESSILSLILFIHGYLVLRYCAGSFFPENNEDQWTLFKRLLIVSFIPFVGYYWVSRQD